MTEKEGKPFFQGKYYQLGLLWPHASGKKRNGGRLRPGGGTPPSDDDSITLAGLLGCSSVCSRDDPTLKGVKPSVKENLAKIAGSWRKDANP
jgi:hypothetical protein